MNERIRIRRDGGSVYEITQKISNGFIDLKDNEFKESEWKNKEWDDLKQSLFIESVLMGLPIPYIYLGEYPDGKRFVIDGLQMLKCIKSFCDDEWALTLPNNLTLDNKTFKDLSNRQQSIIDYTFLTIYIVDLHVPIDTIRSLYVRVNNLDWENNAVKHKPLAFKDVYDYFFDLDSKPDNPFLFEQHYDNFIAKIRKGEFNLADEKLKELLLTWGKSDKNADNKALYDRIANLLIKMETEAMACSFNGDIENLVKEKAQEYNRQLAILVDKISIFISTYAFLAAIIKREFNGNELLDDKEIVYSFVDEIVNDKHRYAYMKITPGNVNEFFDIVFSSNIVSGYDVRYIYQFNYTFSKKDELRNSQYILNNSVLVTVLKALPMPVLEEINKNFDISINHLFLKWFNKK